LPRAHYRSGVTFPSLRQRYHSGGVSRYPPWILPLPAAKRQYQPLALTFSGKWQREAGFETGQAVTVRVQNGCLILTAGG